MSIKGFLEAVTTYQLRGWAYEDAAPSDYLEVFAEHDGRIIGNTIANVFREDLGRAGVGDGDHAFAMNFGNPLSQEVLANTKVYVQSDQFDRVYLAELAASGRSSVSATAPAIRATFETSDNSQHPVFVLGAARSGTSALVQALIRSGWCEGRGEGHLFPLLPRLLRAVHVFYRDNGDEAQGGRNTAISQIPKKYFLASVRSIFVQLPAQLYPTGRWTDKTPTVEMIEAAPILAEIWPNAKFIFARRRGIENIASRIRKFPGVAFVDHCKDWNNAMSHWLRVREQLDSAIEVEHLDVARDVVGMASRLSRVLEMPEEFRTRFVQALSLDRPERTSSEFAEIYNFADLNWTVNQKEQFVSICGDMMAEYRYTLDLDYRS